mmetsp:Transcript_20288/g.61122  ORF Transcript_20288/g.61122 Transcript_20288/m.61122 type:complete len:374 (+) Transcript_20288:581-1702(+)
MGADRDEDSTGKGRFNDARSRSGLLMVALVTGICLGVVFSERLYIRFQDQDSTVVQPANGVGSGAGASANRRKLGQMRKLGKPRSELEGILQRIAPDKEVMIGISNYNLVAGGELVSFLDALSKITIPNFLIVAIDTQLRDYLAEKGVNVWYKDIQIEQSQKGTGSNHAISALKFRILHDFLELGYSVLLSDIDIVWLDNPFKHLYRDHDVEGMTDGFDEATSYGHIDGVDDPSMGWARYAQATRHMNLNSGLFYLRSNDRTIALLDRIAVRLSKEKAWDQSVWNEEIFFLSHDDYVAPNVSVRVMNYLIFMNSKVLFKTVRHLPKSQQTRPISVHINYHPDKRERQIAVMRYYIDGDQHALDPFPGGSEPGT